MTTTFGQINQNVVVADPNTWGNGGGGAAKEAHVILFQSATEVAA